VTTEYRGVFFGRLTRLDEDKRIAQLSHCRNVIYWPVETDGFVGLATKGALPKAKIGPACDGVTVWGVTSVLDCTEQATQSFEA
jgi:hypothetical protein